MSQRPRGLRENGVTDDVRTTLIAGICFVAVVAFTVGFVLGLVVL